MPFAFGDEPIPVPKAAPVMVLRGAVVFPHTLCRILIWSDYGRRLLSEIGNERHRYVCLLANTFATHGPPLKSPGLTELTATQDEAVRPDLLADAGVVARIRGVRQDREDVFSVIAEAGPKAHVLSRQPGPTVLFVGLEPADAEKTGEPLPVNLFPKALLTREEGIKLLADVAFRGLREELDDATLAQRYLAGVDDPVRLANLCIGSLGLSAAEQLDWLKGTGRARLERVLRRLQAQKRNRP